MEVYTKIDDDTRCDKWQRFLFAYASRESVRQKILVGLNLLHPTETSNQPPRSSGNHIYTLLTAGNLRNKKCTFSLILMQYFINMLAQSVATSLSLTYEPK